MSEQGLKPEDQPSDEAFYRDVVETFVDNRFPSLNPVDREIKIYELLDAAVGYDRALDTFVAAEMQRPAHFIENWGKE